MVRFVRSPRPAFAFCLLLVGGVVPAAFGQPAAGQGDAADMVSVEVLSGRVFAGRLDPETDAETFWLRSGREGLWLSRPIRWSQVVQVHVAGQAVSGDVFRRIVEQARPRDADADGRATAELAIGPTGNHGESLAAAEADSGSDATRAAARSRVCSLGIEARVANWDADVEVDGLLVHVYPLDETGATVPVDGMVQFQLAGERSDGSGRQRRFASLGQWSFQIRAEEFEDWGAVVGGAVVGGVVVGGVEVRLPFTGAHPEFDPTIAPHGALRARLSVPGQGTFEATDAMVRIRPYSAVRDRLQQTTGRRFFAAE